MECPGEVKTCDIPSIFNSSSLGSAIFSRNGLISGKLQTKIIYRKFSTSGKISELIMTFAQCQSLVPTVSVFLVYYYTTLYHYIRLHEQPIKYRKSHVDWRSIYINLWKRFFPFVSGADDDVSRTGRISIYILRCSHFSTNRNRYSELTG